jgi:putative phosphoesterase
MRIALISDLHANLQATHVVLRELDDLKPDTVICLGDLIGYGPRPDEVVSLIRERGYPTVLGNHDAVLTGQLSYKFFREPNRSLLRQSAELLSAENRAWLAGRPLTLEGDNWLAAHASPIHPGQWDYLDSSVKCQQLLQHIPEEKDFVFVGHTHQAGVAANTFGVFGLKRGYRFVINPGSVGQYRSEDHRASFCVLDTENWQLDPYKLSYDTSDTLADYNDLGIKQKTARQLLGV